MPLFILGHKYNTGHNEHQQQQSQQTPIIFYPPHQQTMSWQTPAPLPSGYLLPTCVENNSTIQIEDFNFTY